ncbi:unnamed protein product [Rhizophagus irregularis]|uniref:Uncharacterized protein n=1 Tax=Rhizophagus irregularis TaxID=588596 RepID=A0A915Z1A9_9GLOM|nr:unnamed protein product [Rhizophagus irregularis]
MKDLKLKVRMRDEPAKIKTDKARVQSNNDAEFFNDFNEDNEGNDEIKGNRLALQARVQPNNDDAEIFNDLDINNEDFVSEIEANLQKTIEERWNVSKTKQLVVTLCYNLFFHIRTRQFLRYRSAKDASELRYHLEIVNLLLAGAFEMTERSMWLETGEIENEIQKVQRNDTKGDINERSKLGMKHDGMINMIIHGKKYQVGFLEVVGNAFNKNITDRNIDLVKLYKATMELTCTSR